MPVSCCAINCSKRFNKVDGVKFHRLPTKEPRKTMWMNAINRKLWEPTKYSRICGLHFITGSPSQDPTHPDYSPSLFTFNQDSTQKTSGDLRKGGKGIKRKQAMENVDKKNEEENIEENCASSALFVLNKHIKTFNNTADKCINTDDDDLIVEYKKIKLLNERLFQELQRLQTVNLSLDTQAQRSKFCFENLSDVNVKFYTGFADKLQFSFVANSLIIDNSKLKLDVNSMLLLTMMKLKLYLLNFDLAIRFNIPLSTVATVLNLIIPKLSNFLTSYVIWPSQEVCCEMLPKSIKRLYPQCRVILDCSEILIKKPKNLAARAQTWSVYKRHHTIKFLIGLSPNGSIAFVSKCWGGSISDIELAQKCGILNKLESNDQILANGSFNSVEDNIAWEGNVISPSCSKGKRELSLGDDKNTAVISNGRIQVKRAVNQLKTFKIFQLPLSLKLTRKIDDILIICSGIVNLNERLSKQ